MRDNYTRYYLKFIEPVGRMIDDGSYQFVSLSALDGWDSVMGLAFENLVVNNYVDLLPLLHLGGTLITSAAPYRKSAGRGRGKGCQIDLLIQAQGMICIVEVKRRDIERKSTERFLVSRVRRGSPSARRWFLTALLCRP